MKKKKLKLQKEGNILKADKVLKRWINQLSPKMVHLWFVNKGEGDCLFLWPLRSMKEHRIRMD